MLGSWKIKLLQRMSNQRKGDDEASGKMNRLNSRR